VHRGLGNTDSAMAAAPRSARRGCWPASGGRRVASTMSRPRRRALFGRAA